MKTRGCSRLVNAGLFATKISCANKQTCPRCQPVMQSVTRGKGVSHPWLEMTDGAFVKLHGRVITAPISRGRRLIWNSSEYLPHIWSSRSLDFLPPLFGQVVRAVTHIPQRSAPSVLPGLRSYIKNKGWWFSLLKFMITHIEPLS